MLRNSLIGNISLVMTKLGVKKTYIILWDITMLHSGHVCLRLEHESLETRDGFYATLKYTASSTILIESS